jgi:hypothetical protein
MHFADKSRMKLMMMCHITHVNVSALSVAQKCQSICPSHFRAQLWASHSTVESDHCHVMFDPACMHAVDMYAF